MLTEREGGEAGVGEEKDWRVKTAGCARRSDSGRRTTFSGKSWWRHRYTS